LIRDLELFSNLGLSLKFENLAWHGLSGKFAHPFTPTPFIYTFAEASSLSLSLSLSLSFLFVSLSPFLALVLVHGF